MSAAAGGASEWDWQAGTQPDQTERKESGTTTGGHLDQQPVVVWVAANQLEAMIVKGRLESEEIPAMVIGESVGLVYGLTVGRLAAVEVLAPAALAARAMEILSQDYVWDDEESEAEFR